MFNCFCFLLLLLICLFKLIVLIFIFLLCTNLTQQRVEIVVDKCRAAQTEGDFIMDDRACRIVRETPGENQFLNVNTYLQLGGIKAKEGFASLTHLKRQAKHHLTHFKGCLKELIHNKQVRTCKYLNFLRSGHTSYYISFLCLKQEIWNVEGHSNLFCCAVERTELI